MNLTIAEEIRNTYRDLRIGVVVASDIKNRAIDSELEEFKRKTEISIREKFTSDTLVNHPFIWAWRETYRSFGVKPKKYNPTCEALIRRILDGEKIPSINVAVDSYLLAEAEFMLPCGGYDLDRVSGDISLRFSKGLEKFYPLGSHEVEETNSGEVVYADRLRILTRKWNFRDCDFTKITTKSANIGLFIEAAKKEIPTEALERFTGRLKDLLRRFCEGNVHSFLVGVQEKLEWIIV